MRGRNRPNPYAPTPYHPNVCSSCGEWVQDGQKECSCGAATSFMSFAERAKHEAAQWRTHLKEAAEAG